MANTQLKEQILKLIFRKIGHLETKNVSILDVRIRFDNIAKDVFFEAVMELINVDQLLVERGRDYVTFTPNGWDRANLLMNPPPTVNQNSVRIEHAVNSPVQQGMHSNQTQNANYSVPSNDDLRRLVDLMTAHLSELSLPQADERKAKSQLATIDAQLMDTPNPTIVKEAGKSLKNITEGAVGSILATAAQPGIWGAVQSLLAAL